MIAIFLAADHHTLVARHVDHVHVEVVHVDDDAFYESTFHYLDHGMLVLATSSFAEQHLGAFVGVIQDGEDPETLRAQADRIATETLKSAKSGSLRVS